METTIAEADVRRLMRKVAHTLQHLHWRPDRDDLLAEAYAGIAFALHDAEHKGIDNLDGYCMRSAWNHVNEYLRSSRNGYRQQNRQGGAVVRALLWSELSEAEQARAEARRVEPDFAPRLIERLAAEAELERLPYPLREVIRLRVTEELPLLAIAGRLGISYRFLVQMLAAQEQDAAAAVIGKGRRLRFYPTSSGYRGVYHEPKTTRLPWRVRLEYNGHTLTLGRYATKEEGALVYDAAVLHYLDGQGHLNLLPDEYREKAKEESSHRGE